MVCLHLQICYMHVYLQDWDTRQLIYVALTGSIDYMQFRYRAFYSCKRGLNKYKFHYRTWLGISPSQTTSSWMDDSQ